MLKAIINYINVRAERLRPCKHKWEIVQKENVTEKDIYYKTRNEFTVITFFCIKCGKHKIINTKK